MLEASEQFWKLFSDHMAQLLPCFMKMEGFSSLSTMAIISSPKGKTEGTAVPDTHCS
jgi:hypothetical protein